MSIIVVSALVQLALWPLADRLVAGAVPYDFQDYYLPVAESILAGNGISLRGDLATHFPPGYPVLLAAGLGAARLVKLSPEGAACVLNVMSVACSSALLFLLGRELLGAATAVAAAVLWIVHPAVLWLAYQPVSDAPFLPFLFLGLVAFVRGWKRCSHLWMGVAGVTLCMAAQIRAAGLFLVPCLAVFVLTCRRGGWLRRIALCGALLLAAVLTALPWELAVYRRTGQVVLLATGGPAAVAQGLRFGLIPEAVGERMSLPDDVRQLMVRFRAGRLDDASLREVWTAVWDETRYGPVPFAKLMAMKLWRSWYGTLMTRHELKLLLVQLGYLATAAVGLAVALKAPGASRANATLLLVVVAYFWALTCLVVPLLRYMVPAMGMVVIFSGVGIEWLARRVRGVRGTPNFEALSS